MNHFKNSTTQVAFTRLADANVILSILDIQAVTPAHGGVAVWLRGLDNGIFIGNTSVDEIWAEIEIAAKGIREVMK